MLNMWDYLSIALVVAIALYFWYSVGGAISSGFRRRRNKDKTESRQDRGMKA
ncbi:MAG: hypothetical protein ACREV4_02025 [Gammaproteobacteria bacterium]